MQRNITKPLKKVRLLSKAFGTHYSLDESSGPYIQWNKPGSKGQKPDNSI